MRHLLFLIFLIPFGCAHTYEMQSTNGDTPEIRLPSEASFFVLVISRRPRDLGPRKVSLSLDYPNVRLPLTGYTLGRR